MKWAYVALGAALALVSSAVVSAQYPTGVKAFVTRTEGQTIQPAHINDLQTEVAAIETGLLTGLAHHLRPLADATHDVGSTGARWRDGWFSRNVTVGGTLDLAGVMTFGNTALHILDTNASHDLILSPGSDLTADRTLTLVTGDADRTITLSGNPTIGDWFDQDVRSTAIPTFSALILSGARDGVQAHTLFGGTVSDTGSAAINMYGAFFTYTLNPQPNDVSASVIVAGNTINEAASGTHSTLAGLYLQPPNIVNAGASVTNAATLYITNATSASGASNYALVVDAGIARFDGGIRELDRAFNAGATQTVAHGGGNFTGSGSMTWTVQSGDQRTYSYRRLGDTAWITIDLEATTVGGTPSSALRVTLPLTAAETIRMPCYYADNGTPGIGFGVLGASSGVLDIYKANASNWTASTNLTDVACHLALKVS